MNKNILKTFATKARNKLRQQVSSKIEYVLTHDTPELKTKSAQIEALKKEIDNASREEVIEKVAYTWFNRLIALRFMDANGYHPLNLKVISPADGQSLPEILQEAKRGHIDDRLTLDHDQLNALLDGRIPAQDAQSEAFQMLLIATCNAYSYNIG